MDKKVKEFPALEANGYRVDNGIKIELGKSINGSGPEAFGGAKEWPCLRVAIPFQVGQEDKMAMLAWRIECLLRAEGLIKD